MLPNQTPQPEHRDPSPNELRDHLANERTLLAWVRTSITIVGLGFVVAKFGILLREVGGVHVHAQTARAGGVVGVLLVLAGVLTAIAATAKFLRIRRNIERQVVSFSPILDVALVAVVAGVSIILAVYLVATS